MSAHTGETLRICQVLGVRRPQQWHRFEVVIQRGLGFVAVTMEQTYGLLPHKVGLE